MMWKVLASFPGGINMDAFQQSLQAWQIFYATVAAASATLTGLLFLSLSLNRDRLKGARAQIILATARRTFGDFLYVLMIALVFIVPHQVPYSLTIALLVLGASRGIVLIREATRRKAKRTRRNGAQAILRDFGLPLLASIGLIAVALAVAFGQNNALYWLVLVIAALLVTACWNAWELLIDE
jgi:hypothetical protein